MLNFLKRFMQKKMDISPAIVYTELPYHIQQTEKLYPVTETLIGNKADGEIKRITSLEHTLRIGQASVMKNDREICVHIGNDYFKNIVKL